MKAEEKAEAGSDDAARQSSLIAVATEGMCPRGVVEVDDDDERSESGGQERRRGIFVVRANKCTKGGVGYVACSPKSQVLPPRHWLAGLWKALSSDCPAQRLPKHLAWAVRATKQRHPAAFAAFAQPPSLTWALASATKYC